MTQARVADLLAQAARLYREHVGLVLALTVPIVVVVTGLTALGLGELGEHYRANLPAREQDIQLAAGGLVTVPLITSTLARWVPLALQRRPVAATDLLATALEAFPWVLLVMVVWVGAVLVGAILIIPAVYLLVSWYFVVQAVVLDGLRGLEPISRSAALVRGHWWRTAGVLLAFEIVATIPWELITIGFDALARSADAEAVVVAGDAVGFVITLPFLSIGSTLYYLHLRALAARAVTSRS